MRRPGDTLESGRTKEPRTERGTKPKVNMEAYGIGHSNEDRLRLALVPEDRRNAINLPTAGWPSYRTLYGFHSPAPLADSDPRTAPLFSLDPETIDSR